MSSTPEEWPLAFDNQQLASECCWKLQEQGDRVLVAGATGGVGQLVTAKLLEVGVDPAG